MKILIEKPPKHIWDGVNKEFNLDGVEPIFAYGDVIYNPFNNPLDPGMIAHEEVHGQQQLRFEGGVEAWWNKYLEDVQFRFDQEIPAYRVQYKKAKKIIRNREALNRYLIRLADDLSGAMYGSMVSHTEAMKLIRS